MNLNLRAELFFVLHDEIFPVCDYSIGIDVISTKKNNYEFILPSLPFLRLDSVIRICLMDHSIDTFTSRSFLSFSSHTKEEFADFVNSLLDLSQDTEHYLITDLLPELLKPNEISLITEKICKPDDSFLAHVDKQEELEALLIQFLRKTDDNLIWLWYKYLSAVSIRITKSYIESPWISNEWNTIWKYLIVPYNEEKPHNTIREQYISSSSACRSKLISKNILQKVIHSNYFNLNPNELPIIVEDIIFPYRKDSILHDEISLLILVHGLEASNEDMFLIRNFIMSRNIPLYILTAKSLIGKTHESIPCQAELLLEEIIEFLTKYPVKNIRYLRFNCLVM